MIAEVRNATKQFGGLKALQSISFRVENGEILGIIGPNGAGKSTLLNIMSGHFPPNEGEIFFKEKKMNNLSTYVFCERGIGRTFQLAKPFGEMTVLDNAMAGAFLRVKKIEEAREVALESIRTVGLEPRKNILGFDLTVFDRKRLELARCLATRPELVLLDELIAGCTPREMDEMIFLLNRLNESGLTIIMVEHVMKVVMTLCKRIIVLDFGQKVAEGTPEEIGNNEKVIEAYLGAKYGTT